MRLTRMLLTVALLCGVAVAGWFSTLYAIPFHASDVIWSGMESRGAARNQLGPAGLTQAGKDRVPLANPDIVGRRAIFDLSEGPVLFEAEVPPDLEYWSVSVFGHNSDTLFVANDRATGPGTFRLIIRTRDQRSMTPANMHVVSPSRLGFVLVRAVMKDRSDPADVRRTEAAVANERMEPLKDERVP